MRSFILYKERYDVDDVLGRVGEGHYIQMGDKIVCANTRTIKCFKYKGTKCVSCGRKGEFFKLVKYDHLEYYHLWLFARHEKHGVVLMTKDHIIPKSRGGTDGFDNLQVMCACCNSRKGSE